MRKPSVLILFLTVFLDLIGFGIVLPLLPVYSYEFGAGGLVLGLIVASYSAMQFLFATVWGRWSDRIGRRPVLLVSTAGAAISYAIFALGSGLPNHTAALSVLLGSRLLAGICGANITVAQAYIADITAAADRSRRMGLIGMAFGLGFIFGPAIGGLSLKYFGMSGPGWVAAGFCAANFLFTLLVLPESRRPNSEHVAARPHWDQWRHTLRTPKVGLLVVVFFLATFCFTCFETTLGLLVMTHYGLDVEHDDRAKTLVGYLFAYCGVIGALVQGGAIGRLVKKLGEPRLIGLSLVLVSVSFAPLPYVTTWPALLLVLALLAFSTSLTRPPLFGLLSNLTPAHEQGATIGVAQSAGSLARIVGPVFASTLFLRMAALPYWICSGISLLTAVWVWQRLCQPGAAARAPDRPGDANRPAAERGGNSVSPPAL
jgi:DHA1 family tetracycline resistance protein-like MFS transporter